MITTVTNGISSILRDITEALRYPVIIVLLLFAVLVLIMLGSMIVEIFSDHRNNKVSLSKLMEDMHSCENPAKIIADSGLLKSQKLALMEVIRHKDLPENTLVALANDTLDAQEARWAGKTKKSDMIAKLAPMFGLLGTLIPLGPGIVALGQGDTYTLSLSLNTAFDTTVMGLIVAAIALLISAIRKKWYKRDMGMLRALMESLLEEIEIRGNGEEQEAENEETEN